MPEEWLSGNVAQGIGRKFGLSIAALDQFRADVKERVEILLGNHLASCFGLKRGKVVRALRIFAVKSMGVGVEHCAAVPPCCQINAVFICCVRLKFCPSHSGAFFISQKERIPAMDLAGTRQQNLKRILRRRSIRRSVPGRRSGGRFGADDWDDGQSEVSAWDAGADWGNDADDAGPDRPSDETGHSDVRIQPRAVPHSDGEMCPRISPKFSPSV